MANKIIQMTDANGDNLYPIAYGQGGVKLDLLWTNPSPTSSFSAQTVSINLSDYDVLFICHYSDYAQNPRPQRVVSVALKSYGYGMLVDGSNLWPRRNVVVTNTGVQFTDAVANGSTSNGFCVPQYIYGLKMSFI